MFRVKNNVPDVYVEESRDFQLVSALYDLVIQSNRFSIDSMELTSDTARCNNRLLPLIGTKVGLFKELRVNNYMYRKILTSFPYIMRYKGSLYAIQLVANLFERLMNTRVSVDVYQEFKDLNTVTLIFEESSPDITLLNTLLDYVKPTGVYINYAVRTKATLTSDYVTSDTIQIKSYSVDATNTLADNSTTDVTKNSTIGFAQLHNN